MSMWDPYAEFKSVILPNGLTVYAAHWPKRPWEAMGFVIHSGAEHDPVGLEGTAHLLEHLVSENTVIGRDETFSFFKGCGGMVNFGSTNYPNTKYSFFIPKNEKVVARALSIFGHMLTRAKIEKLIERERQVVVREFNKHNPVRFRYELDQREQRVLCTGCCPERLIVADVGGNLDSIGKITQKDLQSYYDEHYAPANISIVGVGGLKLSELVKLISKSPFAMDRKGKRTPLPIPVATFPLLSETRYVSEMSEYFNAKTVIDVGSYRTITKIPANVNIFAVEIMSEMFDSILDEEVRNQRTWAYDIHSSYSDCRYFYKFSINCNALAIKALDEIEEVIETCIDSIGDREDLFRQVKHHALARKLIIDRNGRDIRDGAVNELSCNQCITTLKENIEEIKKVTMDDIRDVLEWLKPERRWTLITKP